MEEERLVARPLTMDCQGCIIAYFSPRKATYRSNMDKKKLGLLTQDTCEL